MHFNFKDFIYFRERESGGGWQRERRECQTDSESSTEPNVALNLVTLS